MARRANCRRRRSADRGPHLWGKVQRGARRRPAGDPTRHRVPKASGIGLAAAPGVGVANKHRLCSVHNV